MITWKFFEKAWCHNGFLGMYSLKLGRSPFWVCVWQYLQQLFEHFIALY